MMQITQAKLAAIPTTMIATHTMMMVTKTVESVQRNKKKTEHAMMT